MKRSLTAALVACTIASGLAGAPRARAEEFLGVEPDSGKKADKREKSDDDDAPKKAEAAKARPGTAAEKRSASDDEGNGLFGGDWGFGGGISVNGENVSADATVSYFFNRYFGIDTTYWYDRYQRDDTRGAKYGPEVDFVARLPNRTILTPFVGAGPGYFRWIRERDGEAYDDSHSYTANAFAGLSLRIIRHLHAVVERKQTLYLDTPPRSLTDAERHDARADIRTSVGFKVVF
jgi:hypothetical protein